MLTKTRKKEMVKEIIKALDTSNSFVFVNFHGLNVADETHLRRELRDKGITYRVSRKTLLKRALEGKAEGQLPELSGEVAIAYAEDLLSPSREVYDFQKTHQGVPSILGGIFEGKFVDREKMTELAMIPNKEVLYAQFVNLINSPIQRFAVVLDQIAKSKA